MSAARKARAVRVEDELWEGAMKKANDLGHNLSEVIRSSLDKYNRQPYIIEQGYEGGDVRHYHTATDADHILSPDCPCGTDRVRWVETKDDGHQPVTMHTVEDAYQALIHALPGGEGQWSDRHIYWQGSHDGGEHITVFDYDEDEHGTDFVIYIRKIEADE